MPHISASQLETFLQCPKKWVAQYIENAKGDPSEALGLGGAFHEVLDEFGLWRFQRGKGSIDAPAMKRQFTHALRKLLATQDPHGKLLKATETMEQKGFAMIDAFCRDVAPKYWPIAKPEEPFEFELPGLDPYHGEKWTVQGRLDARTMLPDGGKVTVDWKTGKKWRAGAEHGKIQATVYLLADLMKGKPVPKQVTFITFPVEWVEEEQRYTCEADIRPTTRTLAQASDTLQALRTAALHINELRDNDGVGAQARASYLCPWCPRYSRCFTGQSFMHSKGKLADITVDEEDRPLKARNAS